MGYHSEVGQNLRMDDSRERKHPWSGSFQVRAHLICSWQLWLLKRSFHPPGLDIQLWRFSWRGCRTVLAYLWQRCGFLCAWHPGKMEEMIIVNSTQSILQSELNQLGKNRATDHFYGFLVLPEHIGSTSCCQFVFIDTASIVAWWLAPSSHNKKVPSLNPLSGLPVGSLHVLLVSLWILSRYSCWN